MNVTGINNVISNAVKQLEDIDLGPKKQPMKTGKAKGWLGEYHWVSLAQDPDAASGTEDTISWCTEHFGKSGHRWYEHQKKFFFKDEKDMSMFILRWS